MTAWCVLLQIQNTRSRTAAQPAGSPIYKQEVLGRHLRRLLPTAVPQVIQVAHLFIKPVATSNAVA